ncbi:polysaccharide biosynthesis protein [Pseudolabrys sp.]|uniref:polysaccharide biosynthesis protein n=1 Tax=Pseudolabrys sp. TaxID=1960880 RepID=UPI003D10A34B
MFENKNIAITGGTGSFGRRILKFFLTTKANEIRVFSRDEKKQEEVRQEFNDLRVKSYIGDIRNYDSVFSAFRGVDYVFHAAALKQVPSCEFYPMEAIRTNVLGADNVMRSAIEQKVSRVVALSTDKAVYPINAMGQTKALMEKVLLAQARTMQQDECILCTTRYGNVMASRGSVIPLFISQIKQGKPITITDPNMTRFLMSLDDSVDLVLHAFAHGRQGDIFVQKAPASTILDLALVLKDIFLSASPIEIIGTRHGEKLFESLISREEMVRSEDMGRYYRIPADDRDLNYRVYFSEGTQRIAEFEDYTSHNTERLGQNELKMLLLKLDYLQAELTNNPSSKKGLD